MKYFDSALSRFRTIALLEGWSFIILLFVAMPLKYGADMPMLVKYTGWAHGFLFVLYVVTLLEAAVKMRWSIVTVFLAFAASLVPFGTFVMDAKLLKKQQTL
ncbi:DUF3817 domain-containing protein [Cesiribacter sp. SM1]|uniref:DUF3817 domain-containing protein n=1 Tax=Cesiribacter sp. SM1 TaxID=2861196 RepID=UPI001CD1FE04|nr:DUF3817 domain-containing protein [Cesiribacter sp. SM1]